jgi:hypothetical protein
VIEPGSRHPVDAAIVGLVAVWVGFLLGIALSQGWVPPAFGYAVSALIAGASTWQSAAGMDWHRLAAQVETLDGPPQTARFKLWTAIALLAWGVPPLIFGLAAGNPEMAIPSGVLVACGCALLVIAQRAPSQA